MTHQGLPKRSKRVLRGSSVENWLQTKTKNKQLAREIIHDIEEGSEM